MKRVLLSCTTLALLALPALAQQQGITLCVQPDANWGKDALVSSLTPNTNFATHQDILAEAWTVSGAPVRLRSFLEFDLTAIPIGANVISAQLSLFHNPTSTNAGAQHQSLSGSNAWEIRRVLQPWTETVITWTNQPSVTLGSSASELVSMPMTSSSTEDFINMNVTAMVQEMVDNPTTNYGFRTSLVTEAHYRSVVMASSDNADPSNWPRLCVTYTLPDTICFQHSAQVGKDAFLNSLQPTTNYGNHPDFLASRWTVSGAPVTLRGLLEFDLSMIPSTATLDYAALSLYYNPTTTNAGHSGINASWLRPALSPWTESTVTWNTQPAASTTNQVSLATSSLSTEDYPNINVLGMAQAMVSNPATNYGIMFQLQNEMTYRAMLFASSDQADLTNHPKLCISLVGSPKTTPEPTSTFQIWPNPANESLSISWNQGTWTELSISVLNLQGQQVWRRDAIDPATRSAIIPRNDLPAGLYLVQLLHQDQPIATQKIVFE